MHLGKVSDNGHGKTSLSHTEELLKTHPDFLDRGSPSLDARLDIVATVAPELAASAAAKAIAKWDRPATDITDLIVSTNAGAHAPIERRPPLGFPPRPPHQRLPHDAPP